MKFTPLLGGHSVSNLVEVSANPVLPEIVHGGKHEMNDAIDVIRYIVAMAVFIATNIFEYLIVLHRRRLVQFAHHSVTLARGKSRGAAAEE